MAVNEFGGIASLSEPARSVSVPVGVTSVLIADVRTKPPRRDILVRNISPNTTDIISVALGTVLAVANTGIVLQQGESFVFSTDSGNPCPQCQFAAICATANGVVAVMER